MWLLVLDPVVEEVKTTAAELQKAVERRMGLVGHGFDADAAMELSDLQGEEETERGKGIWELRFGQRGQRQPYRVPGGLDGRHAADPRHGRTAGVQHTR
ncbi:hypothetical protein TRIUR3_27511 [Triticum urartu]|uniref:Uncharacterized protein n=1 Tax=Triticum urartu TaxID=4572 RepID=M8ATM5_TRIUA|nr:hypothetical protein TRIUR3_27511 [Triticum urartu]